METKLTSLLTVLSVVLTALAAVYSFTGAGYAIELALVSFLALGAWLRFSFRELPSQGGTVPSYILVIVCTLILSNCRYWSDYAQYLDTNWHSFFGSSFTLTHPAWFLLFVVFPVSLMLLGGYYLSRRIPLGFYMAWWTFLYGIAEALMQYKVEFLLGSGYQHHYFIGALAALILFVVSVIGIQGLLHEHSRQIPPLPEPPPLTDHQVNLWSFFFISLVAVYGVSLYVQAGFLPVGVIVGSMMGGMIGWRKTTARHPADPYKVVPLYLLLQCFFYIHVGEETLSPIPFNKAIASLTGNLWPDEQFVFFIALLGPVVWVFAAWSLWKRQPFGNFVLWFMIVGMILGEPTHLLVFPVITMTKFGVDYQYFSGMYTALFPMVPAILALSTIIRDHKTRTHQPDLSRQL